MHGAGSHRSRSVTTVVGHFFSRDSCTRVRGRRTGKRISCFRRASGEQKRNQQNQNACQCGFFDHQIEPMCRSSPTQPALRDAGDRSRCTLNTRRLNSPQRIRQSGQSCSPLHRWENMRDVRSALLQHPCDLRSVLLRRLRSVMRHKRKVAMRLPTRESHSMQHVYSRSRTY